MLRVIALAVVTLIAGLAVAGPGASEVGGDLRQPDDDRGRTENAATARILYLNRCTGGCTVTSGADDAAGMTSSLPCSGGVTSTGGQIFCSNNTGGLPYTVGEFMSGSGATGSAADDEWNQLVTCVKQVYSPYNVTVVDSVQSGGPSYNMGIVAGTAADIGYGQSAGGIGVVMCGGSSNIISFSFANEYGGKDRINTLCGVVAQETAHSYGLDHEYSFTPDGSSACDDPMSYRDDCDSDNNGTGGQRFFRNRFANCGEYATRTCGCGGLQNSDQKLTALLGPGTPITTPPHVEISQPVNGATVINSQPVIATSGAQRGVDHIELWLNGYKWATVAGAAGGPDGQPDPSNYDLVFPATVPDGVIDLELKSFDDINTEGDATMTVTKGAPCTSAATCLAGQKCDAGKGYWDPATGQLGDATARSISSASAGSARAPRARRYARRTASSTPRARARWATTA